MQPMTCSQGKGFHEAYGWAKWLAIIIAPEVR